MGDALAPLGALPTFGMVYVLTLLISLITEMVSNTATVTIVIPIMFELVRWEIKLCTPPALKIDI